MPSLELATFSLHFELWWQYKTEDMIKDIVFLRREYKSELIQFLLTKLVYFDEKILSSFKILKILVYLTFTFSTTTPCALLYFRKIQVSSNKFLLMRSYRFKYEVLMYPWKNKLETFFFFFYENNIHKQRQDTKNKNLQSPAAKST